MRLIQFLHINSQLKFSLSRQYSMGASPLMADPPLFCSPSPLPEEGLEDISMEEEDTYELEGRRANEHNLRQDIFVQHCPHPRAGEALPGNQPPSDYAFYEASVHATPENPYTPFANKAEWKFARWAKLRKVGANTLDALLRIEGLCKQMGLSFHTAQQLNRIIDGDLPEQRPRFEQGEVSLGETSEVYDVFYRDVLQCIKALYGDVEFANYLVFKPEQHFSDEACQNQLFHDMHTGLWW